MHWVHRWLDIYLSFAVLIGFSPNIECVYCVRWAFEHLSSLKPAQYAEKPKDRERERTRESEWVCTAPKPERFSCSMHFIDSLLRILLIEDHLHVVHEQRAFWVRVRMYVYCVASIVFRTHLTFQFTFVFIYLFRLFFLVLLETKKGLKCTLWHMHSVHMYMYCVCVRFTTLMCCSRTLIEFILRLCIVYSCVYNTMLYKPCDQNIFKPIIERWKLFPHRHKRTNTHTHEKWVTLFQWKPRVYSQKKRIITRTVYVECTHKLTENHLENIKYILCVVAFCVYRKCVNVRARVRVCVWV